MRPSPPLPPIAFASASLPEDSQQLTAYRSVARLVCLVGAKALARSRVAVEASPRSPAARRERQQMWVPCHRQPSWLAYKRKSRRDENAGLPAHLLPEPKMEHLHEIDMTINGLQCGHSSMQGYRVSMEDEFIMKDLETTANHTLFAILDGHAGLGCAAISASKYVARPVPSRPVPSRLPPFARSLACSLARSRADSLPLPLPIPRSPQVLRRAPGHRELARLHQAPPHQLRLPQQQQQHHDKHHDKQQRARRGAADQAQGGAGPGLS